MPSIQDLVVSVVRFTSDHPGAARITSAVGTAFFIDPNGTFLTTRSVLQASPAEGQAGLALRVTHAPSTVSVVPITDHEAAHAPWDVAVGRAKLQTRPAFNLATVEASPLIWERVSSYGCVALEAGRPIYRTLAGNVQREIHGDRERAAPAFELSYPVPSRMRGAPVFVHERPRSRLLALCTGNGSVGELIYPRVDRDPRDNAPVDQHVEIDRHGIAQDLRALAHWKPQLLLGRTLRETLEH